MVLRFIEVSKRSGGEEVSIWIKGQGLLTNGGLKSGLLSKGGNYED